MHDRAMDNSMGSSMDIATLSLQEVRQRLEDVGIRPGVLTCDARQYVLRTGLRNFARSQTAAQWAGRVQIALPGSRVLQAYDDWRGHWRTREIVIRFCTAG